MMVIKNFILAGQVVFECEVPGEVRLERCIYNKISIGTGTRRYKKGPLLT